MSRRVIAALLLSACSGGACGASQGEDHVNVIETPVEPNDGPVATTGPAPTFALVDAEGGVHVARRHEGAIEVRATGLLTAHPPAIAIDGSVLLVAEGTEEAATRIVATRPFGDELRIEAPMDGAPVLSLYSRDLRTLLGREGEVHTLSLRDEAPSATLVHRVDHDAKPIDFFVALGDHVVGVDDFRMPKWALVFDRDFAFEFSATLPEETNEGFVGAASHEGVLWIVSNGATISDQYSRLMRCELEGQSFSCTVREESLRRGAEAPASLLAGDAFSYLHGVAPASSDVAYVCAYGRGLLRVAEGAVTVVEGTGAESGASAAPDDRSVGCIDVARLDDALVVLLDGGARLSIRDLEGAEQLSHPLDAPIRHLAGVNNRY